jgi:hypothetical protein
MRPYDLARRASMFLIALSIIAGVPGCMSAVQANKRIAQAPTSSDVAMGRTGFYPKGFLCELARGPRYTPEERARARSWIGAALIRFGMEPKEHRYEWRKWQRELVELKFIRYDQDLSGTNLYAELPATVPSDEWIVVGAHYDTVRASPGADDDASGTTAVLMVAEALSGLETRRKNVLFVFFDQEEEGPIGSLAFVEEAEVEGRKMIAMHDLDMLGWDGDGDRAVEIAHAGDWKGNDDPFVKLYGSVERRMPQRMPMRHTDMRRSDHESFVAHGIPAVLVIEEITGGDFNPNYHAPGDTCDTLDYAFHRMAATLVATAVAEQLR